MEDIFVGETVTPASHQDALPILHIDEPTFDFTNHNLHRLLSFHL